MTKMPANTREIAEQLISLGKEFLGDKLTQGEFLQDLEQLTDQVKEWAAETPAAYA